MDNDLLKKLYYHILRIRLVEEKIAALYPEQEMRCPVHLSIGQEAVAVGACAALAKEDYALSGHRSHAHYLAKGGNLNAMLAEIYGKQTGCCHGKGGSMHLIDLSAGFLGAVPIVGSTIPIAVGTAFGSFLREEMRVTLAFLGEGATEEGVFHESINFAMLKKLPIVFVCENNLYSVYSPLVVRQPADRSVVQLAQGHGIEGYQADGNDLEQVYTLTKQAVEKARQGNGPTFLEFATYRWREHCGPYYDNNLGYRTETEFESWKHQDPLARVGQRLSRSGLLTSQDIDSLTRELEAEITEAFTFAKTSPFPDESQLLKYIYAS